MGYEVMSVEETPCACGAGTFVFTFEMDDWNRTRSTKTIRCGVCQAAHDEVVRQRRENEIRRAQLLERARALAAERYLARWMALFEGVSKKVAWERYTGGEGYPTLGTFYKHVKDRGLAPYMRWCFMNDIANALKIIDVNDSEVAALLAERDAIPHYSDQQRLPL